MIQTGGDILIKLSRRDFLKGSLAGAAALAVSAIPGVAYADKTGILSEEKKFEEGQYSFEIPPEKVPESEINETLDVDICIVGAGQAGTLAALTAGKLGAKTVVLQKPQMVWCHGRVANMIHFDPTVLPEGNAPPCPTSRSWRSTSTASASRTRRSCISTRSTPP